MVKVRFNRIDRPLITGSKTRRRRACGGDGGVPVASLFPRLCILLVRFSCRVHRREKARCLAYYTHTKTPSVLSVRFTLVLQKSWCAFWREIAPAAAMDKKWGCRLMSRRAFLSGKGWQQLNFKRASSKILTGHWTNDCAKFPRRSAQYHGHSTTSCSYARRDTQLPLTLSSYLERENTSRTPVRQ